MKPISLRTERLRLDQPGADDIDLIAEYCRDPLFEHWLTVPWPYEREHAAGFVHTFVPDGWRNETELTWAIRHPERGFLGVVGITLARPDRPSGMLGFWLGAPHRGHGFLPEAARAAVDEVFALGLVDRIEWEAVIPNRPSLVAARKLGFRYLGERDSAVRMRDGGTARSWYAELGASDDRDEKPGWP